MARAFDPRIAACMTMDARWRASPLAAAAARRSRMGHIPVRCMANLMRAASGLMSLAVDKCSAAASTRRCLRSRSCFASRSGARFPRRCVTCLVTLVFLRRYQRHRTKAMRSKSRLVEITTTAKTAGLSETLKELRTPAASSSENRLNLMLPSSSIRSSVDRGMRMTPPKSVRWVELQWRNPSGAPLGGAARINPSELQTPFSSSQ